MVTLAETLDVLRSLPSETTLPMSSVFVWALMVTAQAVLPS